MMDIERAEGAYVTLIPEGLLEIVDESSLIKIERVNGDCTVSQVTLTPNEAWSVFVQLREVLVDSYE